MTMSFLAWLLIGVGFAGVVLPVLPATPLVAGGIVWLAYQRGWQGLSLWFWVVFLILTGASLAADYVVLPLYVRKKGGARSSSWAAALGLIVGAFVGLPGLILGPFIAVFLAEVIAVKDFNSALRSAMNTVAGLFLSALAKFGSLLAMVAWYLLYV